MSYTYRDDKVENTSQIEVFLTTYVAGYRGGGCNHTKADSNALDVRTSIEDLKFERDDTRLNVNALVMDKGDTFQTRNVLHWNPWIISRMRFRYLGIVSDCESESTHQRSVIIGSYGTEFSIVKGALITSAIVFGIIYVNRKLLRIKEVKKSRVTPGEATEESKEDDT